ncbi:MAG TPA: PilN domain-containing protein [Terriglobia bacterium]|nr:PilN domain-containing protein [Terriglobia bacterium]
MIKINLLGVAPPPSAKALAIPGEPAPTATLVVMFVGALIVCFGVVGVIYKVWSNQIADLEKARNRERIRQSELRLVKDQNNRYQSRLQDLETRINTIQALQSSRVGPVELMTALGNVVNKTSDLYLYTLAPAGDRLQLKGQSSTPDSMASFLADLKASGAFTDVQLDQFYQDDLHDRLAYKFTVSCLFKSSGGAASPTAGGAPVASGGPAGGTPGSAPQGLVGQPAQVQQRLKQSM